MQCHIIPTGRVWMEAGGVFGLVPRPLWIEKQPLDSCNRIPMDLNSLLIQSEGKNILVDTGMGNKLSEKRRKQWNLEWPEGNLIQNLLKLDISPEDIDIVINSHLHSDHCGGNTIRVNGEIIPTFPKAEYWVQRIEFADAMRPNARTKSTYLQENFNPLWKQNRLNLLHGDTNVTSEIQCRVTPGHTTGHQCIVLTNPDSHPVVFVADMATFAIHMEQTAWVAAYDVTPLESINTKIFWQDWAIKNKALLIFQHDTITRKGTLHRNSEGQLDIKTAEPGSFGIN